VCVLGTLGGVLDVGGEGEGACNSCVLFCHALFLGGFCWFSLACEPWLRGVCRVADGSVVWIWVFGEICLRDIVGLCLVVLGCRLGHGVLGHGIWGIRVVFGGVLGQNAIFGGCFADLPCVLVGFLGSLS
jgi:hypothetical protein